MMIMSLMVGSTYDYVPVFREPDTTKDLYSKKDMKLVFSRFISCGKILCYSR
jgi:hypothetical protein